MTKKADKTYSSKSQSRVISKLQEVFSRSDSSFRQMSALSQKEMRFAYDMLSRSEADSNFFPTERQGKYCLNLLFKLEKSGTGADVNRNKKMGEKNKFRLSQQQKTRKPSNKKEHVARRKARAHVNKHLGIKQSYRLKDIELSKLLNLDGGKKSAIKLLIKWSNGTKEQDQTGGLC